MTTMMADTKSTPQQQLEREHFRSTLALCSSVFCLFYLSSSVFPYLGFMVLDLIPSLTKETVGIHVGFLASSLMIGRTFTSYGWGLVADIYGRKFVLVVTLLVSAIGSLAFGCSTSYTMAISVRFIMGTLNATMIVARTSISELAKGDKALETKGVAIMMSMVGYSMLICPALGGLLAEPMQQYPQLFAFLLNDGDDQLPVKVLLEEFPFLLPNLLACVLSLVSLVLVVFYVEETLPEEQRRHWSYLVTDVMQYLYNRLCCYRQLTTTMNKPRNSSTTNTMVLDPEIIATETTPLKSKTIATAIDVEEGEDKQQTANMGAAATSSSIQSIWNQSTTRAYLISAWCNHFASVCHMEAFPLFAMSTLGGLGLQETMIGVVGTLAGLFYCLGQYTIFQSTIKHYGLVPGIQHASLWAALPIALMPLSLLFTAPKQKWIQIVYLSILTAAQTIARSIFFGGNTIGCNRTVPAHCRAAMNGLSSTGTGLARGLGPIFAGWLLATVFSSTPSQFSAWLVYAILSVVSLLAYGSSLLIVDKDEE